MALKRRHRGETAWIVGKGPSLRGLRRRHFGAGPIITLNQSLTHVRTLGLPNLIYTMQKDGALVEPRAPEELIVSSIESVDAWSDYAPRYVMHVERDLGLQWGEFSAPCATVIAKLMGCRRVVYLCFDAVTKADRRVVLDGMVMDRPPHLLRYYRRAGALSARLARPMKVVWVTP